MKLLVVSSVLPHPGHSTRAANVVVFELTRALAAAEAGEVAFLNVARHEDPTIDDAERAGLEALSGLGITVLDPVRLPPAPSGRSVIAKVLRPQRRDYYPEVAHENLMARAVESYKPDVVLVPWSEWVTALCANFPARRFAYYGNPDHKAALLRARYNKRHGGALGSYARAVVGARYLRRIHLDVIRQYDWIGNVAANDAAFYEKNGHPEAFYVPNLWLDRFGPAWKQHRARLEQHHPAPIIGNVGKLFGTANRYGLEYLRDQVIPELRRLLPANAYRVNLLGSGEPPPELSDLFEAADVHQAGFVPDIDAAILAAPVFLCVNNGTDYKVGHTRYLHAWSLGACVVAHRDASLSMPEIKHRENALLGSDGKEIAELIKEALGDSHLRQRLGEAGYETFRKDFSPHEVARRIIDRIVCR